MSDEEMLLCHQCNGSGQVVITVDTDEGPQPMSITCAQCGGSGRVYP